jgi:hypothetical protein
MPSNHHATSSLITPCTHPPATKDYYITARIQDITAKRPAFLIFKIEKWAGISPSQVFRLYAKTIEHGRARRCQ